MSWMKFNKLSGRNVVYVICDGMEKGDLRSTTKGIATLIGQFVEFWKNGLWIFNPAKITTNYAVGKDGTEHPDPDNKCLSWEINMLKNSSLK